MRFCPHAYLIGINKTLIMLHTFVLGKLLIELKFFVICLSIPHTDKCSKNPHFLINSINYIMHPS
jgi:hypothetical protein